MELPGIVSEGVVKFDEPGLVPDGTKVTILIGNGSFDDGWRATFMVN